MNLLKVVLEKNILNYVKNIFYSTLSHIAGLAITFIVSVLLTRSLGVEGRGVMSWILYFATIGAALARIGMGQTSRKFIAEEPKRASDLTLISIITCIIGSAIVIPVLYFIAMSNGIGENNYTALLISLFIIPFIAISSCIGEILVGLNDGKSYNKNVLLQKISVALLVLAAIVFKIATPLLGVLLTCASFFLKFIHGILLLRKKIHFKFVNPKWVLKNIRLFTFMSYLSFIFIFLSRMIIPVHMGIVSTKTQIGLYSSVIILIEAMHILPNMIGLYILPELSKHSGSKKWKSIFKYSILGTFILIGLAALFFYIISNWLIVFLYGIDFKASIPVFNILLISLVFFSLGKVIQSTVLARFNNWLIVVAPTATVLTSIISSYLFVKSYGAIGGAYASTITNITMFLSSSLILVAGEYLKITLKPKKIEEIPTPHMNGERSSTAV